jgi:general secretion pathway protein F
MQFAVRSLSPDLSIRIDIIEAADAADARRQCEARGLVVSTVEPQARSGPRGVRGQKFSLALFSQELLALLNAGLGIVEALEALLEKEGHAAARALFESLLASLREGQRFSAALAGHPAEFPPLYVGIVRAAEGTSDLPRALARFIDYQQRIDAVRAKIVSASIYPMILLGVGTAVSLFLMTYVVPRFAEVYQGAGRDLPWMSQLMLAWGQFAAAHTALVLAAVLGLVGALVLWWRRMSASGGWGALLARLPGLGERARIYELSRLYLTLGMLVEGGITIVNAIDTVQGLLSAPLRRSVQQARTQIEAGLPLSVAFEQQGLTTPISLRMLRVGERSGDMGPMLTQSAVFYDGEIARWVDRFTRTFEPLLMAAIGLVVGVIVVLLYMPIFDLAGDLS